MQSEFWKKIKEELTLWRVGLVPGIMVQGVVFVARLTGALQFLEWTTLDYFLRLRPQEAMMNELLLFVLMKPILVVWVPTLYRIEKLQ